ncbi:MAG: hypothetical protein H0W97_09525 [Actinobacteria bacterium]|nr:hypothetical protein [Actinomycetota bacterium]
MLDLERSTRLPAIQRQLDVLPGLAASGMPGGVRDPGAPRAERRGVQRGTLRQRPYLLYDYTETRIQGSTLIGPASFAGYRTWPLKVGTYEIRLLMDDGYRLLAISNSFKVVHAST